MKSKSGTWSTLFASNALPSIGGKHEKSTVKSTTSVNEDKLFWEVAEIKTKKETKEIPKSVVIDSRVVECR